MDFSFVSDEALHLDALQISSQERALGLKLLEHLREIERRRLYVQHGATSLHSYCTGVLKYSEGAAARRVNASRLLADLPELAEPLASGEINLSNLSLAQSFIKAEEVRVGKRLSQQEKTLVASRVRGVSQDQAKRNLLDLLPHSTVGTNSSRPLSHGATEFTFVMSEECLSKYRRVCELNSHRPQFANLSGVVEALLDEHLARRAPELRSTQRHTAEEPRPGRRVYLPIAIMAELHRRAGSCCEFVDDRGRRCARRYHLQVDHIVPLAAGGGNGLNNLQLLCRPHNLNKGAVNLLNPIPHSRRPAPRHGGSE